MFNIETSVVDRIANSLSDAEILAISALLFGLVGGLVAFLANRFWFRYWPTHGAYDDKLGEAAHTAYGEMYCMGAGSEADAATTMVYSIAP